MPDELFFGSGGKTLEEFQKLYGDSDPYSLSKELCVMNTALTKSNCIKTYDVVLYPKKLDIKFYQKFISHTPNLTHDVFTDPSNAITKGNKMIKKRTNGLIETVLDPDDVTDDTVFIFINVVYFLSRWQTPFDPKNTMQKDFTPLSKNVIKEQMMMINKEKFAYYEDNISKVVVLPYKGDYSMWICLPNKPQHFSCINTDYIRTSMSDAKYQELSTLSIPKFTHRTKHDLIPVLKTLGLDTAFSDKQANFQNMSNQDVFISKVIHECIVKVDEFQTEAAAYTKVIMKCKCARKEPKKLYSFIANRTFSYAIVHTMAKTVVFNGVYDGN